MKKLKLRLVAALAVVFIIGAAALVKSANTDIWNLAGQGVYWAKDMVHVDSGYNLRLYNGSLYLGDNALAPSTTNTQAAASISTGGSYGLKVPYLNSSGITSAAGMIVCSSGTSTNVIGVFTSVTATTTVLGVADAAVATGSVGYMTVSGYAMVLTTGAVKVGDLLVSSATTQGRAGASTGTVAVGTVIGKALTAGAAAGDSVLAIISQQ